MSSVYPITASRLASVGQALSQALADSKTLFAHFAGSRFEPSITIVIDLITAATTLVQTVQQNKRVTKRLIATVTGLATAFVQLPLSQQRHVLELALELFRSDAYGPDSARTGKGNP